MGKMYDDEEENEAFTEAEAKRLVKWVTDHGHSKEEAYEALAYVMNATPEQQEA